MKLCGLDSVQTFNDIIWSSDSPHLKLNILDSVLLSENGFGGWLFTSSDGSVKSKSKGNWTADAVNTRSRALESGKIIGHFSHNGTLWRPLVEDGMNYFLQEKLPTLVIPFGYLEAFIGSSPTLVEESFEIQGKGKSKFSTSMVCDSKAKGLLTKSVGVENVIPPERIVCVNKSLSTACKNYMQNLIQILEGRRRIKISKLVAILLVENDTRNNLRGLPAEAKNIWLHHIKEFHFDSLAPRVADESTTSPQTLEKRSVTSNTVSVKGKTFSRPQRCLGDFCKYSEAEEARVMAQFGTEPQNIRAEAIKAKKRHRRLTEDEEDAVLTTMEGGGDEESGDEADYLNGEESDTLANLPGLTSEGFQVPFKSIALAREESTKMESIATDKEDEITQIQMSIMWPETLIHWWLRLHRGVQKGVSLVVPTSSADRIKEALLANTQVKGGSNSSTTREALPPLSQPSINKQFTSPRISECSQFDESIPFDLTDNSFSGRENRKAGHMSWYYSDARVCSNCYRIYKELDIRRKRNMSTLLQSKKNEPVDVERGKEIERRIFSQRKMVSRLSSLDSKPMKKKAESKSFKPFNESSLAEESDMSWFSTIGERGPSNQRPPVPASILPPRPWQLGDKGNFEAYTSNASAFIRNIGKKSHELAAIVRQDKMLSKYANEGGVEAEWLSATGQLKDEAPAPVIPKASVKKEYFKAAHFDPERLLHPYQRGIQQMRDEMRSEEEKQEAVYYPPVKILLEKRSVSEPKFRSSNQSGQKLKHLEPPRAVRSISPISPVKASKFDDSLSILSPSKPAALDHSPTSPSKLGRKVSFSSTISRRMIENEIEDDSDNDDEGIGWSPFVIPS